MKFKIRLFGFFIAFFLVFYSFAATKIAVLGTTANWSAVVWKDALGNTTSAPTCGDNVVINGTVNINSNISFGCSGAINLTVNGTINFINNFDLTLPANSTISIPSTGTLMTTGSGGGASNQLEVTGAPKTIWTPGSNSSIVKGNPFTGPFSYPTVLGVKFESVTVQNQNNLALISWTVSEQVNNSFFIIEKSTNAIDWKIINSLNGDGNLKDSKSFSILDFETTNEIQYYRIKQVDYNGEFKYSEIVSLNSLKPLNTNIYPNPSKDFVYIEISSLDQKIIVSNELGKDVTESIEITKIDNFHYQLDISSLRDGAYIVKLNNSFLKLYKQ